MFLRLVVVCMLGQAWSLPQEPQPLGNHREVRAVQSRGIDIASLPKDLDNELQTSCRNLAAALIKILGEHGVSLTTTEKEVSLKEPRPLENHGEVYLSDDLYNELDGPCLSLGTQVMNFLDKHGITTTEEK